MVKIWTTGSLQTDMKIKSNYESELRQACDEVDVNPNDVGGIKDLLMVIEEFADIGEIDDMGGVKYCRHNCDLTEIWFTGNEDLCADKDPLGTVVWRGVSRNA